MCVGEIIDKLVNVKGCDWCLTKEKKQYNEAKMIFSTNDPGINENLHATK